MYVRLKEEEIGELLVEFLQKKVEKGKVSCETVSLCLIKRGRDRRTNKMCAEEDRTGKSKLWDCFFFLYV
jgi:hypothetical protein